MAVSATVSGQQQGSFGQDKVLERTTRGVCEARAAPPLRRHRLALGSKGSCWAILGHAALGGGDRPDGSGDRAGPLALA